MSNLLNIAHQGLIFSLVAMAVFLTSRVIRRDDLSVEGTFGIGGAMAAFLAGLGVNPLWALLCSTILGALMGSLTGLFYTRLGLNYLMAGLVTTTGCFSISLALCGANKILRPDDSLFSLFSSWSENTRETLIILAIVFLVLLVLLMILRSQIGLLLRATGENPELLVHFSKSSKNYQVLGFSLANALTALAGALFVQWSGFFSITGNVGVLITGLTSLMIAELVQKKLSAVIILASMAYQSIFSVTLAMGIPPVWNNLVKAGLIILLVVISKSFLKNREKSCLK